MPKALRFLLDRAVSFGGARRGASAILVALCMIPMIGFIGLAVDGARGYMVKAKLSEAIDSAGLAAARETKLEAQEEVLGRFFAANFPPGFMDTVVDGPHLSPNQGGDELTVTASVTLPTTFMRVLNIDDVTVSARTVVKRQTTGFELVLVMDNTGSMSQNNKMTTMKAAATDLIDILFADNETIYGNGTDNDPTVWVGLVPYVSAVNIGPSRVSWLAQCNGSSLINPRGALYWMYNTTYRKSGTASGVTRTVGDRVIDPDTQIPYEVMQNHTTPAPTSVASFAAYRQANSGYYQQINYAKNTSYSAGYRVVDNSVNPNTVWELKDTAPANYKTHATRSFAQERSATGYWTQIPTNCPQQTAYFIDSARTYYTGGVSNSYYDYNETVGGTVYSIDLPNSVAGWAGCVEERDPGGSSRGNAITDAPPSVERFLPYYYPAEGGTNFFGMSTGNPWVTLQNTSSSNISRQPQGITLSVVPQFGPNGRGPNFQCPSEVTPMTPYKSTIIRAINHMTYAANRSGTMSDLGAVWGWRMISPRWRGLWGGDTPSDMPLAYNTQLMQKIVIILTDGENTTVAGDYTAHGRSNEGKLGSTNTNTIRTEIDARTLAVCTAMKAQGIIVYTIMFQESDPVAVKLFQDCATDIDHYYYAPDNATLQNAFRQIGGQLSELRILE